MSAKVINIPRVRARVDCQRNSSQSGYINISRSQTTGACARVREERMRSILRRLPPRQRKFALAVKRVLEVVPGPENLQREKIMEALKIGRAMYFRTLQKVDKNLV